MKRFSKLILSVAAVSAVSAAMVISASAMGASYADGEVTLTDVTGTGTSQTLLVLDTVDLTTVAAENIKQIDQKDDSTSFATVKVGELADGTYEVRIGGDGTVQKATFTVGEAGPTPSTKTIMIGDVNDDEDADMVDAASVATYSLQGASDNVGVEYDVVSGIDAAKIMVGDVNNDEDADMVDAASIATYSLQGASDNVGIEIVVKQ